MNGLLSPLCVQCMWPTFSALPTSLVGAFSTVCMWPAFSALPTSLVGRNTASLLAISVEQSSTSHEFVAGGTESTSAKNGSYNVKGVSTLLQTVLVTMGSWRQICAATAQSVSQARRSALDRSSYAIGEHRLPESGSRLCEADVGNCELVHHRCIPSC